MKRFNFLLLFWGLIALSGCEKEVLVSADCADGGAFIKRVDNANGRVYYDPTQTKYMILVPNSIDSHDVGFVCSLNPEFQKEGLLVRFNGRYYAYSKTLERFAGDKFYSLSIETISTR